MNRHTDVVVIGGGYSGVMAANRLTQRDDVSVTLINPRRAFVERIRLHQLLGGSDDAVVDYADILAERVRLVIDTVTQIDTSARSLTLATGATLDYDYVIYAAGSATTTSAVPGADEFAYPTSSLEQALRLRSLLDDRGATISLTVVGGGPLGIEVAAELAEAGRRVTLVCGDRLGPYLHPRGRRSVMKGLTKLGVTVLEGAGSTATAVTRDAVHLDDGREILSAVTIWAAGFGASDLARRSGLSTDTAGRLRTDETLTSVDDDRIIAAGDAAGLSGLPLRMSAQAALPLGAHAADTVLRRISGEQPVDCTTGIAAMCISLGRRAAVFQLAHRDDTATRFHAKGRLGARLKESACASPIKQLAHEARDPGSHTWPVNDTSRDQRLRDMDSESPAHS